MDTNREAVYSLISLLVRKAGFDVGKNLAEQELIKTREEMKNLAREKRRGQAEETLRLMDKLKIREDFWQNNAEVIGKRLINDYLDGKPSSKVKADIDKLVDLANKGTNSLQVSDIYARINELNKDYNQIKEKIDNNNYINLEEKEIDYKYKTYLENKISSLDSEISEALRELDELRETEAKDLAIVNRLTSYNESLKRSLDKLDKASNVTNNSDLSFEIWEKLQTTKDDIEVKLDKAIDALSKTEDMLKEVRDNRMALNKRRELLENESMICRSKLAGVDKKLEEDEYINTSEQIVDASRLELITLELETLNNKKDVIYVESLRVKEELIRAWDFKAEKEEEIIEEVKTPPQKQIIKIEKLNDKNNIDVQENRKIELEW